jgi:hypothetical protein
LAPDCHPVEVAIKSAWSRSAGIHDQVAEFLSGFPNHAVCHDHPVAVLRVALQTQQADRLLFRKRDRLTEIERGFRFVHMGKEDAIDFQVPPPPAASRPRFGTPRPRK